MPVTRLPTPAGIGQYGLVPVVPPKLRSGSSVRVIAPSRSLAIIGPEVRAEADRKLAALGLTVSFGERVSECDDFSSSPAAARLADLHAAFADPGVDAILTVIGGFNANQLLTGIDYSLVAAHPKVLCGFSDVTVLSNALYARAGLVGYSGPHYSSFGMKHQFGYTEAGFRACVMEDGPITLAPSPDWSDDAWFLDQEDRHLEHGEGWWVLQEGEADGTIVGGNLCTLNLLQGTSFMPPLEGSVVFAEDDDQVRPWDFDRDLVSLLQQPAFRGGPRPGDRPVPEGDRDDPRSAGPGCGVQARAGRPAGDRQRRLWAHHPDRHVPGRGHGRGPRRAQGPATGHHEPLMGRRAAVLPPARPRATRRATQ